jgi:hypothetical protein
VPSAIAEVQGPCPYVKFERVAILEWSALWGWATNVYPTEWCVSWVASKP